MAPSAVCVDVEPGGTTQPKGAIGVAELVADEVVSSFLVRFSSPFYSGSWQGSEAPGFGEVWPWLESFVGGRPLVAHGAAYDRKHLRRLLSAAGAEGSGLSVWCSLTMGRRAMRAAGLSDGRGFCATSWALRLWPEEEIERRRVIYRSGAYVSKWLLHDAADDALVCADVVRWVMKVRGQRLAEVLAGVAPLAVGGPPAARPGRVQT